MDVQAIHKQERGATAEARPEEMAEQEAAMFRRDAWATQDSVAVIPAYEPDSTLAEVVDGLGEQGIADIIIVDDGSSPACASIFEQVEGARPSGAQAVVLHNMCNLGKGASIKKALAYIAENRSPDAFVVTVDADGQHRPKDAKRVLMCAHMHPESIVIGARNLNSGIPMRSRLGNGAMRVVFRLATGKQLSDTQTGLRAFSARQIPRLLEISGSRYEYEMNMLLAYARLDAPIEEVSIATIYHDKKNTCSHYNTLKDSLRIFKGLVKFAGSSFLSFLVDYALFLPLTVFFGGIVSSAAALVCSNVTARIASASLNYYLNSTFVFRSTGHRGRSILQYAALATGVLMLNTAILYGLSVGLGISSAIAKIMTELVLFAVNFTVQRFVIFNRRDEDAALGTPANGGSGTSDDAAGTSNGVTGTSADAASSASGAVPAAIAAQGVPSSPKGVGARHELAAKEIRLEDVAS